MQRYCPYSGAATGPNSSVVSRSHAAARPSPPGSGSGIQWWTKGERDVMWVSCREAWVYAASLLCRHISVIKNSAFLLSISGIWTTSVFGGSIIWIASYSCYLFSGWALTFIAASRPTATVANPHIVRSLSEIKENPHTVTCNRDGGVLCIYSPQMANPAVRVCGSVDRVTNCHVSYFWAPQSRVHSNLRLSSFSIFSKPITQEVGLWLLCNLKGISCT